MTTDYIIVGQGLCGTFLSWNLKKAGKKIVVIDKQNPYSATRVASGVINPVTGRRIVRTWEIEKLMPFAVNAYKELGNELGVSLIQQCNLLDFFNTPQMKLAFEDRLVTEKEYLRLPDNETHWYQYFNPTLGIGEIKPCWLIDLQAMLDGWRKKLIELDALRDELFNMNDCRIFDDHVEYKDITAQKIFFCDGIEGLNNTYFKGLPYAPNKGEALIVSIPGLPAKNIYKQGISIVPWKEDLFWVGSSFEWNFSDPNPTNAFREKTEQHLHQWLKLPFETVEHFASVRPANVERRPFVGFHPLHAATGILNGMGTKGCSLSPYFADELTQLLLNGSPINPLADVGRFSKILSKNLNTKI